jgi:hypothetical protein
MSESQNRGFRFTRGAKSLPLKRSINRATMPMVSQKQEEKIVLYLKPEKGEDCQRCIRLVTEEGTE